MSKMGRPTDYKEEFVQEVDAYLKECKDRYDDKKLKVNLPTKEGFMLRLDICKQTLYNWADKHKDFLDALSKIEKEQKKRLLDMGLSGEYNSTIAKLILSSNHGMRERTDVTSDGEKLESVVAFNYIKPNEKDNSDNQADTETAPSMGETT